MTAPGRGEPRPSPEARRVDGAALAAALRRRGLGGAARLLVEAHRPYLPLAGDAATFLRPILRILPGRRNALGEEGLGDAVDRFLEQLEGPEARTDVECQTSER